MRPISQRDKERIAVDPFFKRCARGGGCKGRITVDHAFLYAGRQIAEYWNYVPLCEFHHLGSGLDKRFSHYVALRRAKPEELAKYPKRDWNGLKKALEAEYGDAI